MSSSYDLPSPSTASSASSTMGGGGADGFGCFGGGGREVLTLQFGSASNFVGAHYWNAQDERAARARAEEQPALFSSNDDEEEGRGRGNGNGSFDPGILYREGRTDRGATTYTPRMVLFDFKASFGSLNPLGSLYYNHEALAAQLAAENSSAPSELWSGGMQAFQEPAVEKNPFLKYLDNEELEDGDSDDNDEGESSGILCDPQMTDAERAMNNVKVRTWSDFLKAHLHPRSSNVMHRFGTLPFDVYTYGKELVENSRKKEECIDSVRFFLEECDSLQGVQCFADVNSGYGGLAEFMLLYLRDECPRTNVLTMGIVEPFEEPTGKGVRSRASLLHDVNVSLAAASLSELSSIYIPISLHDINAYDYPFLSPHFDATNLYHSSALLASAFDAATAPFRICGGPGARRMGALSRLLSPRPAINVAEIACAMPFPYSKDSRTGECKLADLTALCTARFPSLCLRPNAAMAPLPKPERIVTFGTSSVLTLPGVDARKTLSELTAYSCSRHAIERINERHFACAYVDALMPVPVTFPRIFNAAVGPEGQVAPAKGNLRDPRLPGSVSSLVDVSTSNEIVPGELVNAARALRRVPRALRFEYAKGDGGIDADHFIEMANRLEDVAAAYGV